MITFCSFLPNDRPSVPFSTITHEIPFGPREIIGVSFHLNMMVQKPANNYLVHQYEPCKDRCHSRHLHL